MTTSLFALIITLLSISCHLTESSAWAFIGSSASKFSSKKKSHVAVSSARISADERAPHSNEGCWALHALFFSSLTDGIFPNSAARSFLQYSLANTLLREHVACKEGSVKSSIKFSPCNGPNMEALNNLENADRLYDRGQQFLADAFGAHGQEVCSWSKDTLRHLTSDSNCDVHVRVLYIPTAMYALNPQSSNTPGKQRQRLRADGKKRRTQLLGLLEELLSLDDHDGPKIDILAVTLDLDDGSLKQPTGSEDASLFPKNDKEALSTWHPHLIYVEGGNTFWIQHCIEKGDYSTLIKDACKGPSGAVYCGKSAGAIVAGSAVSTATWKGWDDPSVVPGKESPNDWLSCRGFDFAGNHSFFPHMSDDWREMVEERIDAQNLGSSVYCLREEDACCTVGDKKLSFITSAPMPAN